MGGILCPIRGGPASNVAIELGIGLAKQTGEALNFLYVVNLDFLNLTERGRTHVISDEMRGMGEFILLAAQDQAAKQGIKAQCEVRQGNVTEEIIKFANELGATQVVLGRPRPGGADALFTTERLRAFIEHLEGETSAKVVLTEAGGEE